MWQLQYSIKIFLKLMWVVLSVSICCVLNIKVSFGDAYVIFKLQSLTLCCFDTELKNIYQKKCFKVNVLI